MMNLSPGVSLLVRSLAEPTLVAVGLNPLLDHFDIDGVWLSPWTIFGGAVILKILRNMVWTSTKRRLAMWRLNAAMPPAVRGYVPGNIDLLIGFARAYANDYPGDQLAQVKEELGCVVNMGMLWEDVIYIDHPDLLKEILVTDFPNYIKGQRTYEALGSLMGTGIFNSDGETWKFHRAMTRPFFTRDRITDFDIFDEHAEIAISKIRQRSDKGEPIDVQDLMGRFTMDSAAEFLFGVSVHSLDAPFVKSGNETQSEESDLNRFSSAFQSVMDKLYHRFRWVGSGWQLFELFGDRTASDMKMIYDFVDPMVDMALRVEGKGKRVDEKETLLAHLVSATDDRKMIRDELLNILTAGRDTTASTLTFAVYLLAQHAEVLKTLRKEVLQTVGPTDRPTFEHIKSMKYLRAVINETLRLFPAVPFNIKESVEERVWNDPVTGKRLYIPAHTKIAYSVLTMQRDRSYWGSDAIEFIPERWIDDRKQRYLSNPFIFLPFQAGPRICVGQQFAYNEVSFFLIKLLQRVDTIELAPEAQPIWSQPPSEWKGVEGSRRGIERVKPRSHLTLYSQGGMWTRMDFVGNDTQG